MESHLGGESRRFCGSNGEGSLGVGDQKGLYRLGGGMEWGDEVGI